jgi:hypothetical protein
MKLTAITLLLLLTGCANSPYSLAKLYDSNDPCQRTELIKTGQYPSFCGGGSTKYITADYRTGKYLTVTKAQK